SKGGAAIRGYDPVAYFEAGEPVRGSKEHSLEWHGAEWHFSSAENLAKFEADPTAFAPQYGGYCAFAMSRGSYASTDPEAWRVVDGKLYLNYNKGIQKKWLKDRDANIVKADANWKEFWAAR
ncbi:MAG: YHS domain-containing (seleno)protein, partial [Pseudomonadota bacterium]